MAFEKKRFSRIIGGFSRIDLGEQIIDILSSTVIIIRRFIFLIFSPYKTMRKISLEKDYLQVGIILVIVFLYFKFVYFLKDKPYPATFTFLIFLFHFFLTVGFFYVLSRFSRYKVEGSAFIFTFSYALFPTLIWFLSTSIFYILAPPPRGLSFLGKGFSIFYTAYSLSLFAWKMILVYLALRFSSKAHFFQIVYVFTLYLLWFLPYSILLYYFRIFRVPFI